MNASLVAHDLTAGYRSGGSALPIVSAVNVQLRPGELVCLLGINGAGKSTLLRTIAGLQAPLAGMVLVGGIPVHSMPRVQRARRMSLVLTERSFSRNLTGLDVVRLGRHPYTGWHGRLTARDQAVVEEAIARTGCEALVGKTMTAMSDGERQRVLIARAVAQSPQVMLLDEPTAFLDVAHRVRLTALLRGLTDESGIAVLMSTHDLELALRVADTIWLIRGDGSLLAEAPEDIAISEVLAAEFSESHLGFDDEAGGFRIRPNPFRGPIAVSGEGRRFLWTMRGLERAGFAPRPAVDGLADVRVEQTTWLVGDQAEVTTVDELLRLLVNQGVPQHAPCDQLTAV